MTFPNWLDILLELANQLLASTVAILAFSLLAYVLAYNVRSRVARAFSALLACVLVVYTGDVLLSMASSEQASFWLRLQWIGISFVPAAYFDLSDALLRTTNALSKRRLRLVNLSYGVSTVISALAVFTDLVVRKGTATDRLDRGGLLFWVFVAYFVATSTYGLYNTYRVRQRCLTPASRRRMTYLTASFAAPGLGVFPYLMLQNLPEGPVLLLTLIGNLGVGLMLVLMTYSIAYYGVLSPDRVIKRSFIVYLIRGPLLGILVVGAMLTVPPVESILGLPRDTVLLVTVVAMIVLLQLAIELVKPSVDRLIYGQDNDDLMAIRELDRRLLTSNDLRQFLENVLVTLCEYLRVKDGFVIVQEDAELLVEARWGPDDLAIRFENPEDWQAVMQQTASNGAAQGAFCVRHNGCWVWPLRTKEQGGPLGLLGVAARPGEEAPRLDERAIVATLVERAETALEDRLLQQAVFLALQEIMPEIEQLQGWRSMTPYVGAPPLQQPPASHSIIHRPDFHKLVKDALSHYWGGPKLTDSPLIELRVVSEAAEQEGGNPTKGLRTVLAQAIEGLKPEGQRHMTASEWLLYNILEMKFLQGKRVREIAERLAMSESDLYRKQRVAIQQVAKQIKEMEANNHNGHADSEGKSATHHPSP